MWTDAKTQPAQLVMGSKPQHRTRPIELLEQFQGRREPIEYTLPLANIQEVFILASEVLVPSSYGCWKFPTTPRPVALIAGDLLHADTSWFHIIYLGLDGKPGGGTRYGAEYGIDAAQKAVLKWGQRHFRQEKISE